MSFKSYFHMIVVVACIASTLLLSASTTFFLFSFDMFNTKVILTHKFQPYFVHGILSLLLKTIFHTTVVYSQFKFLSQ
jgi:hypothetical protein